MIDQPQKTEGVAVEGVEIWGGQSTLRRIWALRSLLILVLTPILLLPLPIVVNTPEGRCAYVVFLMATYWITESIPICITALIPVILLPMLNLVTADDICKAYMNDTIMVFLGGLIMAVAIEKWNVHKRIALRVLLLVGTEARWLMLGLMLSTWFLSMWISNTASTAMMVPIAEAILLQLRATRKEGDSQQRAAVADEADVTIEMKSPVDQKNGDAARQVESLSHEEAMTEATQDPSFLRMCKALSLCIAYAASSGGIASLTGTGPNLVLKGQSDQIWREYKVEGDNPINFASWMAYCLPLSIVILLVEWLWLQTLFLRCKDACSCLSKSEERKEQAKRVKNVIKNEYASLGPVTFAQGAVMGIFLVLVVLWVTRDLGGVGGWGNIFENGMVEDSTPAILISVILFIFPSTIPNVCCPQKGRQKLEYSPLLHWRIVHEKMPWSLFLLLGGGYALAKGCQDSGLSRWIGDQMTVFKDFNPWIMLLILCYICTAATEVTSNTAIATLVMPILANLAVATGANPLFYMFPPAIAVSFAFCLPVATPPNAIVFSYGHVKVIDMAKAGMLLNVVTIPILVLATATWGNAIFHFLDVPEVFRLNSTAHALVNLTTA